MKRALIALLCIIPGAPYAATKDQVSGSLKYLSVPETVAGQVSCTAFMVDHDLYAVYRGCLAEDDTHISFMPGLNMNFFFRPGGAMPFPRAFGAIRHEAPGKDILLVQTALRPEGTTEPSVIGLMESTTDLPEEARVIVAHYGDDPLFGQVKSSCVLTGGTLQECQLPPQALGAPVLLDGLVAGIVSRTGVSPDFLPWSAENLPDEGDMGYSARSLDTRLISSVDVRNDCDVDVHQGILYLDEDGETWQSKAVRVKAKEQVRLDIRTPGNAFFSYARSDDGRQVWAGQDIRAKIKGIDLPMKKIDITPQAGASVLHYRCE